MWTCVSHCVLAYGLPELCPRPLHQCGRPARRNTQASAWMRARPAGPETREMLASDPTSVVRGDDQSAAGDSTAAGRVRNTLRRTTFAPPPKAVYATPSRPLGPRHYVRSRTLWSQLRSEPGCLRVLRSIPTHGPAHSCPWLVGRGQCKSYHSSMKPVNPNSRHFNSIQPNRKTPRARSRAQRPSAERKDSATRSTSGCCRPG